MQTNRKVLPIQKKANRKSLSNGPNVDLADKDFVNDYKYIQRIKGSHV